MLIDENYIKKATGLDVFVTDACNSTFDEIGTHDVIIAKSQKYGSGRGDHSFHSPCGGIYTVMRECGLNIDPHTLTPAVGLAVRDSIKRVLGVDARLKWVNDVFYSGKKICGILCRQPRRGEFLIGIGINFSTDINELQAAGLTEAGTLDAPEMSATPFVADMLNRVHTATLIPFDFARYNSLCETVGKDISFTYNGSTMQGYAERVERDGTLIVRMGPVTVAVDAGEVNIIRQA